MTRDFNPAERRGLRQKVAKRVREAALRSRHRADQLRYLPRRPPLPSIGRHIIAELRRDGVAAVPLEALPFASNPALLDAMPRVCQHLDEITHAGPNPVEYSTGFEHCIPINPSKIATDYPELFMWGLDESLLDIIENALGLEAAYHGACIRTELVDGKAIGTRLWHRDSEDFSVIRVMIYLTDVLDDESGPFEYIPRHSSPSHRKLRSVGLIDDDEMRGMVPKEAWRRVMGPRGTVVFGAVSAILHHGQIPRTARKTASFHYTTRHPSNPELCRTFSFAPGIPYLREPLTDRQRACLWEYQDLLPSTADQAPRNHREGSSSREARTPAHPPTPRGRHTTGGRAATSGALASSGFA